MSRHFDFLRQPKRCLVYFLISLLLTSGLSALGAPPPSAAGRLPAPGAAAAPPVRRPSPGAAGSDVRAITGTIVTNGGDVTLPTYGNGTVGVEVSGTWTGTLTFQVSVSGTTFVTTRAMVPSSDAVVTSTGANGTWSIPAAGWGLVRVAATADITGTATVKLLAGSGSSTVRITDPGAGGGGGSASTDPTAPNAVELSNGTTYYTAPSSTQLPAALVGGRLPVDGSGVTQPVSGTVTITPSGTQTVSGTVTANAGTGTMTTAGAKTNNNAAPGATNVGTLGGLANAASPSWTEGNQVTLSTDLAGNLRQVPLHLAVNHGANPTTVAAGAYAYPPSTRGGIPFDITGHPGIITVHANYTTAQTNTVVVANSAGTKIVVTGFMLTESNANSVNVSATLGLAASTTPTTTGVLGAHPGIAAGSGFGRGNGGGILGIGADGDQVLITTSVPTGGSEDLVLEYYTTPS